MVICSGNVYYNHNDNNVVYCFILAAVHAIGNNLSSHIRDIAIAFTKRQITTWAYQSSWKAEAQWTMFTRSIQLNQLHHWSTFVRDFMHFVSNVIIIIHIIYF